MSEQGVVFLFSVLAGLGLMLIGTKYLSEAFQVLTDSIIRRLLNSLSKSSIGSLFSAAWVAFFVQSRTSTSVMAVSFASSGLLTLNQLIVFLLGANVGTVLTPWIFVASPEPWALYLLGAGVLPMLRGRWLSLVNIGKLVFALGLLLLGFKIVQDGVSDPFYSHQALSAWLPAIETSFVAFWGAILLAVGAAFIVRSTVVLVGLVMALVGTGLISTTLGVICVLGINLGSSLPSLLIARDSTTLVKRGVLFFGLSNFLGIVGVYFVFETFMNINLWVLEVLGDVFGGGLEQPGMILLPISHVTFNLFVVLVFGVLAQPLKALVSVLVKAKKQKELQRLQLFGQINQLAPSLALELAHQEIKKMAAMVETILLLTNKMVDAGALQQDEVEKIVKYEGITDNIRTEVREFLARITEVNLTPSQGLQVKSLMRIADELESIADNCKGIFHSFEMLTGRNELHVKKLMSELNQFFGEVLSYYEYVFSVVTGAEEMESLDSQMTPKQFQRKIVEMKMSYLQLMSKVPDRPEEAEVAVSMGEILVYLIQIRSHTQNVFEACQDLVE